MRIASDTHYDEETFSDLRMDDAEVASSVFSGCTFAKCSFAKCIFRSCRFINCTFRQCDLSLARVLNSVFSGVTFEDSKTVGLDWTEARWSARIREPLRFVRCVVSHSTFNGLRLQALQVRECMAADVDFRDADLSAAHFSGTDLTDSLFSNTNLSGADLRSARNYRIEPGRNVLTRAKFSLPEALSLLYELEIVLANGDE